MHRCWSPQSRPRPLRSLERLRLELGAGIVSLVGPNGAGKTNLLEALYFALTGRSFRTGDRRDLIPFGGSLARAEARVRDDDGIERTPARLGQPRRGAPPPARRQPGRPGDAGPPPPAGRGLLARPAGAGQGPAGASAAPTSTASSPPAGRSRSDLRQRFGQALAQRNALVARVAAGRGAAAELDAWDATRWPRPRRR